MASVEEKTIRDVDEEGSSSEPVSESTVESSGEPDPSLDTESSGESEGPEELETATVAEISSFRQTMPALEPWSFGEDNSAQVSEEVSLERGEPLPLPAPENSSAVLDSDLQTDGYLALGPLSGAKRAALTEFLAASAPDASFFVCDDTGTPWKKVERNKRVPFEVDEPVDQKLDDSTRDTTPPHGKFQAERSRFAGGGTDPETGDDLEPDDIRGWCDGGPPEVGEDDYTVREDEVTLRVNIPEDFSRSADNTMQVSVRRPKPRMTGNTLRFAPHETSFRDEEREDLPEASELSTSEESGVVAVVTEDQILECEVLAQVEPANKAPVSLDVDSGEETATGEITVERTKRFNKNTPEYTRVIQTDPGAIQETAESSEPEGQPEGQSAEQPAEQPAGTGEAKPTGTDEASFAGERTPDEAPGKTHPSKKQEVSPSQKLDHSKSGTTPPHGKFQDERSRFAGGGTDPDSASREQEEHLEEVASERKQVVRRTSHTEISTQVDITAMGPGGREDTSPVVTYDERAHNRIRFQLALTLQSESNFWTGLVQDISGGGLFVATYNILPLGSQFAVTFSLPDGKPRISGTAEVRWLREYRDGLEVPPGMGVCFLDLSDENRRRINDFVKNRETILFED